MTSIRLVAGRDIAPAAPALSTLPTPKAVPRPSRPRPRTSAPGLRGHSCRSPGTPPRTSPSPGPRPSSTRSRRRSRSWRGGFRDRPAPRPLRLRRRRGPHPLGHLSDQEGPAVTCRAALLVNDRPQPQTARERLEVIDRLSDALLDAVQNGASHADIALRVLDIQGHACIGAAYERRRERGEP